MGLERFSPVMAPILAGIVACGGANHQRKNDRPEPTVTDLSRSVAEAARCISTQNIGKGSLMVDEVNGAVRCLGANGRSGEAILSVDPAAVEVCMSVQNSSDQEFVDCIAKASDGVVKIQEDVCANVTNADRETSKVCGDVGYARERLAQELAGTTHSMDSSVGKDAGDFEKRVGRAKASIRTFSDRAVMDIMSIRHNCVDKKEIKARVAACEWAQLEESRRKLGLNNALSRLLDISAKQGR